MSEPPPISAQHPGQALRSLLPADPNLSLQRALMNGVSHAGLVLMDERGIILELNGAAERAYAASRATMLGQSLGVFLEPHGVAPDTFQRLVEHAHRFGRATLRDVLPTLLDPGVLTRLDRSVSDSGALLFTVSERLEVLAPVLHRSPSDDQLSSLLDAMAEGVVLHGQDGSIVGCNESAQRILGLTEDQLLGRTSVDPRWKVLRADGTEYPGEEHPASIALRSGEPCRDVLMGVSRPSGSLTWIQVHATPVTEPGADRPRAVLVTFADVTARRDAEARLRENVDLLRSVFESAVDAIVVADDRGTIESFNPAAERLFGYAFEEVRGRNVSVLMNEPHRSSHDEYVRRYRETGAKRVIGVGREVEGLRKDGSLVALELGVSELRVGGDIKFAGTLRDITARKQVEEAFIAANEQLQLSVEELERLNREHQTMNAMGELLQNCLAEAEAYTVFRQYVGELFPQLSGCLFTADSGRNILETSVTWGEVTSTEPVFTHDDCWGMRRGQSHAVSDARAGLRCRHVPARYDGAYVCVPVTAQGRTLGMLHVALGPLQRRNRLRPTLEAQERSARMVAEHLALALANLNLRETLRLQAVRDPLTGLYNRRYLDEALERELRRATRTRRALSLMMADVDHFKRINDTFGHEAGDAVLKAVADLIRSRVRFEDVCCRYGGEEFFVILPEAAPTVALGRAEAIREQLKATSFHHHGRAIGPVTLSFGIAAFPVHGDDKDLLLRLADAALYRAKAEGRDRALVATPNSKHPEPEA
jgi:diguanylate cyclase (GGDEF)-like protein/PAS domain S-box-containing protein